MKNIIFLLFGFVCLFSCSGRYTPSEYVDYVNENKDYKVEFNDGEHKVICTFLPVNLLALQEMDKGIHNKNEKEANFNKSKSIFETSAYFRLTLGFNDARNVLTENVGNQLEYALKLNYLTSNMDQSFFIIGSEGDTIRASLYEYQRNYGNAPDATMIFAFPKDKTINSKNEEIQFLYKDNILGLSQLVHLNFKTDKLKEDNIEIKF